MHVLSNIYRRYVSVIPIANLHCANIRAKAGEDYLSLTSATKHGLQDDVDKLVTVKIARDDVKLHMTAWHK